MSAKIAAHLASAARVTKTGLPTPRALLCGVPLGALGATALVLLTSRKLALAAEEERVAAWNAEHPEARLAPPEAAPLPAFVEQDFVIVAAAPWVGELAIPRLDLSQLPRNPRRHADALPAHVRESAAEAVAELAAANARARGGDGEPEPAPSEAENGGFPAHVPVPPQPLALPVRYLQFLSGGAGGYHGLSPLDTFFGARGADIPDDLAAGMISLASQAKRAEGGGVGRRRRSAPRACLLARRGG